MFQWSSKGGNVTLVDLQEQQLQDGLKYVHQLRAETSHSGAWGDVTTAHPSALEFLLEDAWLVVEVSSCIPGDRNYILTKISVSRRTWN